MKKGLLILVLALSCWFNVAFAQTDDLDRPQIEAFSQQMERVMEEMQKMMGDMPIMMDTFMIKGFTNPMMPGEEWSIMPLDSVNSGGLFDLLHQQMQELDEQDWAEIQQLLEQFGGQVPLIPTPEDLQENAPEEDKKGKKKKKRKVYTL